MARKYLKGGALNPEWCEEQDIAYITESVKECIAGLFSTMMDVELNLQLAEGVNVKVSNSSLKTMCEIIDTESEFEAKFNFIKNHSDTPEDLQLAKQIVGLW